MSHSLRQGANFATFAAFNTAFQRYCNETKIDGEPVEFIHTNAILIKDGEFGANAKNRLIYKSRMGHCKHRLNEVNGLISGCEARYKLLLVTYANGETVLRLAQFEGAHRHHTNASDDFQRRLSNVLSDISRATVNLEAPQQEAILHVVQKLLNCTAKCCGFTVHFTETVNGKCNCNFYWFSFF